MAVNLTSADLALKSYYLDAIAEQLDKSVNPFYAMIKKSEKDVYGKDVKKLVTCGVNGGVGAGAEDGELPQAGGNLYKELTLTLKNLYGTVEISDKAVRAAANSARHTAWCRPRSFRTSARPARSRARSMRSTSRSLAARSSCPIPTICTFARAIRSSVRWAACTSSCAGTVRC